ncbi:TauD/TfdA family dioxygenase [Crocosphaera sp.]|uniref:TauD/TfdA family dioxygenase n=1 Tax=Crocosphaera sp. TaxID=2729996 RepID=UPI0026356D1A|nr:TauD/TfdA family dioxygenase [Crocosphaera sp.]MDJ0583443.1 TauD/TfdA family dioxygenase [Crocosphaera sp.]
MTQTIMQLETLQKELAENGYLHIQSSPDDWMNFIQKVTQCKIMPQDEGELIYDVKSTPGYERLSNGKSQNALRPHTEASYRDIPPQYIVLRCLQPSSCGGGYTAFVDGYDFLDNLSPEVKIRLSNEHHRFMSNQGQLETFAPVLKFSPSNLPMLRFNYNALYYGEHSPDVSKMSNQQEPFLPNFCQEVFNFFETQQTSIRLQKEEMLILDNYRMLHLRTSFSDPNRHLQNIWMGS